jgi:glycosyltransferase involved in cell wall biosynthesis
MKQLVVIVMADNKNVAVITNAFRETETIKHCIKQFKPFNLFHVVLCNNVSWNGDLKQDDTPKMAKKYGASLVVEGPFTTEAQQFNYGLSLLQDYKMVIICDADERYEQDDIRKFIEMLENCEADAVKTASMSVYWKDTEHRIIPDQNDNPTIAVKPIVRFIKARSCDAKIISWMPITLHHFSYVRSDEDMLKKITTFSHSDEFNLMQWYNDKWLDWDEESLDLHPVVPSQFKQAVWNPAPEGIKL